MNNWIRIEDKLPEDSQRVIVYFERTGIDIMKYHDLEGTEDEKMGKNLFTGNGFLTDDVTHWMPVPEPPKKAGIGK